MKKLFGFILFALASTNVRAQLTDSEVKTISAQFMQRIGVGFSASEARTERETLPHSGDVLWQVSQGELYLVVDDRAAFVRSFTNGTVEREARVSTGRFYATREALWARGEAILSAINPGSVLQRWECLEDTALPGQRRVQRGFVSVSFSQVAHGRHSLGVGNYVSIMLDSATGRIASLTQNQGWTYDQPRLSITAVEAEIRARNLLSSLDPSLLSSVRQTTTQYIRPVSGFGSQRHLIYRSQRRIRFGYVVRFDRCDVFIDAETGESLGGARQSSRL